MADTRRDLGRLYGVEATETILAAWHAIASAFVGVGVNIEDHPNAELGLMLDAAGLLSAELSRRHARIPDPRDVVPDASALTSLSPQAAATVERTANFLFIQSHVEAMRRGGLEVDTDAWSDENLASAVRLIRSDLVATIRGQPSTTGVSLACLERALAGAVWEMLSRDLDPPDWDRPETATPADRPARRRTRARSPRAAG